MTEDRDLGEAPESETTFACGGGYNAGGGALNL